ncbi:MAG: hypothetical protein MPJ05_08665 [Nitrosopumilus sp.]|nr:hypothetical protein [Nitrosopumilus sp.]
MRKLEPEDIRGAEWMAYMLVYAPVDGSYNVPVPSDTLFQKQMFMLSRRQETGLRFTSWKYGPFSKELFDAMNINKKQENLVRIPEKKFGLALADKKINEAKSLWGSVDESTRGHMVAVKGFMNDMDYREAASYIYSIYPEFTKKSETYEDYCKYRVEAACPLLLKRKTTLAQSATVACMPYVDFVDMVRDGEIPEYIEHAGGLSSLVREIASGEKRTWPRAARFTGPAGAGRMPRGPAAGTHVGSPARRARPRG